MNDTYTCPKCLSQSTYFLAPRMVDLKCMDCNHVWAFKFILFLREWKAKVAA